MHVHGLSNTENIKNKTNIISTFDDFKEVVLETLLCNNNIKVNDTRGSLNDTLIPIRETESGSTSDTHYYNQTLGLKSMKLNPLAKPFIPRTYLTREDTENFKILDSNALPSLLNMIPVAHEISTPDYRK